MKWPFVSRSRYDAVNADRARLRGERGQFAEDRDTLRAIAESASEKYNDACIVNECLTRDLTAVRKQLAEDGTRRTADLAIEHDIYRRNLAATLGEETGDLTWDALIAEVSRRLDANQRRIAHLEKQLDHALGLDREAVRDGRHWQQTRQDKGTVRP